MEDLTGGEVSYVSKDRKGKETKNVGQHPNHDLSEVLAESLIGSPPFLGPWVVGLSSLLWL